MKTCKYLLPCGDCDKYNTHCKATANMLIDYNILIGEIDSETAEEMKEHNCCEHEWRYVIQSAVGHHYICTKCGMMKVFPLENLSATDKECDHNWESAIIIDKGGYEYREEYRCSKCGTIKT